MAMQFERLFTPITIRNKTIKNRIISPAHAGLFNFFRDELPPDQYIEYQRARAKGGCGLIVLSNCQIHKSSSGSNLYPPTPEILAPKLKRMADTLHEYGTVVTMQLYHRGNTGNTVENIHANWGFTPLPSHEAGAEVCHEMNEAEVEEIIKSYILY